jgi:Skp family chaperone for outer membrane proteins
MKTITAFLALTGVVFAQQGAGAVNVAVVNLPVASERYQKTADLEVKFEGVRAKLNEQRAAMRDKIDKLARSLQEELKPGTEAFAKRQKELAMQEAELQWFVESQSRAVEQSLADSLREIYEDIKTVVGEVALERGLDVVLASDLLPPQVPGAPNQVRQQILLQKVVYWSPRVDLTDEVVARLNTRYQKKP